MPDDSDTPMPFVVVSSRILPPEAEPETPPASDGGGTATVSQPGVSLVEQLGAGGFGLVYRGIDRAIGREVAVKLLRDPGRARERFVGEAVVTGNLQHPHIIPVHALGQDESGRDFFTMPVVRGRTLARLLADLILEDPATVAEYPLPRLIAIMVAVGEAVAYAHANGVIHRDLKPANIMLGPYGEIYVMDWGLAKVIGWSRTVVPSQAEVRSSAKAATRVRHRLRGFQLTIDGEVVGTPGYMAPEQARGELDRIGAESDIYALGVILFELVARRLPFAPDDDPVQATAHGRVQLLGDQPEARDAPAALAAIVERAMAHDPDHRYRRATDLVRDLRALLEDRPVAALPEGPLRRLWRWSRRHRTLSALAAGVLATALAAGAVALAIGTELAQERADQAERNLELARRAQRETQSRIDSERQQRERFARRADALSQYMQAVAEVQTADRNRNRLLSALAAADRALAIDPEFPEAHHARGTILDRLGRPAEAVAAYTRAAELLRTISGRDDPELLKAIGLVYWNERDYAGAKLWFRRAAAATDDRIARLATTLVSAIDGNRMQAVGDLRALVEEDPDLGEAWNALGFLLLGNRVGELGTAGGGENPDPRGAEQAYGEAVRCRPADPDPRIGRAQARLDRVRRGDGGTDLIAAARHDLEIAAAIAPEDRDARSAALQTALATGDWQGAIPHAEALARIAPRDPQGVLFRAWALSHAGRVKEVLPDLQAVLAEPIGNPTLEAQLTRLRDEIAAGKVVDRSPRLAPRVTPAAGP